MTKYNYSKEEVEDAINNSETIREFIETMNLGSGKEAYRKAHYLATKFDLKLNAAQGVNRTKAARFSRRLSDEEFFVIGKFRNGVKIRQRLIALGYPYECYIENCPTRTITEWLGKKIVYQVDHINGINLDNRIENLRFLCPICHTNTETYGSKNMNPTTSIRKNENNFCDCGISILKGSKKCRTCNSNLEKEKKIIWPSTQEIVSGVEKMGYLPYSITLGVSDNAVRGHLRRGGVNPLPKKLPRKLGTTK